MHIIARIGQSEDAYVGLYKMCKEIGFTMHMNIVFSKYIYLQYEL